MDGSLGGFGELYFRLMVEPSQRNHVERSLLFDLE